MIKKEYMKHVMKVIELQHKSQILAGSVTSVTTSGLDDDLILPSEDQSGNPWENAW
jgi:hypothetical protein